MSENILRVSSRQLASNYALRAMTILNKYPDTATIVVNKGQYQDAVYDRIVKTHQAFVALIVQSGGDPKKFSPKIIKES